MQAGLAAAREHRVGVAALDQLRGLADRVRAGRARGHDGVVRALDPERDRQLPARGVDEDVRQEVRRHAVGPALAADLLLLEDPADAPDRGAEDDPHAHRVEAVQPGVPHRLAACAQREEDVPLELSHLLRRGHLGGVEVLDLGGDAHRRLARVERPDPVDAALAGHGRAPGRLRIVPERRDRAEPCDRNPPHHLSLDMRPSLEVTKEQVRGINPLVPSKGPSPRPSRFNGGAT